jgi:hypothetical protein
MDYFDNLDNKFLNKYKKILRIKKVYKYFFNYKLIVFKLI